MREVTRRQLPRVLAIRGWVLEQACAEGALKTRADMFELAGEFSAVALELAVGRFVPFHTLAHRFIRLQSRAEIVRGGDSMN